KQESGLYELSNIYLLGCTEIAGSEALNYPTSSIDLGLIKIDRFTEVPQFFLAADIKYKCCGDADDEGAEADVDDVAETMLRC
ncbi:hypothetical protein PV325_013951, partial [Microctonus aethiopoides]